MASTVVLYLRAIRKRFSPRWTTCTVETAGVPGRVVGVGVGVWVGIPGRGMRVAVGVTTAVGEAMGVPSAVGEAMGVPSAVGEAASVRVRSAGISPVGTRVVVASTATTVAPGGASMVGLAAADGAKGSVVGLGRVQPPTTMMATIMVKVNAIAVDAPLLMACLLPLNFHH